mmetsp:Transcript_10887/g.17828  ORF Transcript_10887/g.17828 Transcript_10887/m.17828 type:complete len:100 (-) Transcript_10887:146-445(-)
MELLLTSTTHLDLLPPLYKLAQQYKAREEWTQCVSTLERILDIYDECDHHDPSFLADVLENLGECFVVLGDKDSANEMKELADSTRGSLKFMLSRQASS